MTLLDLIWFWFVSFFRATPVWLCSREPRRMVRNVWCRKIKICFYFFSSPAVGFFFRTGRVGGGGAPPGKNYRTGGVWGGGAPPGKNYTVLGGSGGRSPPRKKTTGVERTNFDVVQKGDVENKWAAARWRCERSYTFAKYVGACSHGESWRWYYHGELEGFIQNGVGCLVKMKFVVSLMVSSSWQSQLSPSIFSSRIFVQSHILDHQLKF